MANYYRQFDGAIAGIWDEYQCEFDQCETCKYLLQEDATDHHGLPQLVECQAAAWWQCPAMEHYINRLRDEYTL